MEERIRVPAIASAPDDDELDLDALEEVAGGLDRAWSTGAGAAASASPPPMTLPIRG